MPAQISEEDRRKIVRLRALDYTKQEIAEQVGVSRNSVRRHLEDIRDEIESSDTPELALAEFLFDPDDLVPYVVEQSTRVLEDLDQDLVAVPLGNLTDDDDN